MRLMCVVAAVILTGCATLSENDRILLQQRGVSEAVYDKMVHHEPLDIPDIIELSKRRVPASFTLRYLRSTSAIYRLTRSDVRRLRRAGVDPTIVDYMLATPRLAWTGYAPYWDPWSPYYGPYPYGPWSYGPGPYWGVRPYYRGWNCWY